MIYLNLDHLKDREKKEKIINVTNELIKHLKNKGIQKQELADSINVSAPYISKLLNAKSSISLAKRLEKLEEIATKKNISIDEKGNIDDKPVSNISDLATRLAINLADSSTKSSHFKERHKLILSSKRALSYLKKSRKRERFVMVTGADASYVATKHAMPTKIEASKKIIKEVAEGSLIWEKLIKERVQKLKNIYGITSQHDDFEYTLMACSIFNKKKLLETLQNVSGIKYVHSLLYDLIAHMFKHRFIDLVLNFNFDEILDEAIKEEIAGGDWHYIYSDGHCPDNPQKSFFIEKRLKKPIYIKPHGTIQFKDTLKLTREDHIMDIDKIQDTMYSTVSYKVNDDSSNGKEVQLPINFIIVGFNMKSPKFIKLIRDFRDKCQAEMRFWIIDRTITQLEKFDLPKDVFDLMKDTTKFIELKNDNLNETMLQLWNEIMSNFGSRIKPKDISRHLLLYSIFSKDSKSSIKRRTYEKECSDYFKQRFYVELVIALLKSDGILNFQQIYENGKAPAGKYFRLYKKHTKNDFSIQQACEEIGMKPFKEFNKDTFIYKDINEFIENRASLFETLTNKLKSILSTIKSVNYSNLDDWKKHMETIKSGHRLKITPKFDNPHNKLFPKVKKEDILHTSVKWLSHFKFFLSKQSEQWDLALSVSEQGRTFKSYLEYEKELLKDKKIELILAAYDTQEVDDQKLHQFDKLDLLSKRPLLLPWWQHQRHMVLFLKRKNNSHTSNRKKDWKLVKGFYYKSPLLSRCVNPFVTKNDKDLEILLQIFAKYWIKAKHYTELLDQKAEIRTTPIIRSQQEIEDEIQKILNMYDNYD